MNLQFEAQLEALSRNIEFLRSLGALAISGAEEIFKSQMGHAQDLTARNGEWLLAAYALADAGDTPGREMRPTRTSGPGRQPAA